MRAWRIVLVQHITVMAIVCVSTSCDGGSEPEMPPTISLSATSLSFQGLQGRANPASQSITLANSSQGTLTWTATTSAPWVTLTPASGTAPTIVVVAANTAGLSAGTHAAIISFAAPGATNTPATLPVNLSLTVPPGVGLSATTFSFTGQAGGPNPANQTLTISNTGGGSLNWSATDDAPWLTLSATSGTAPSTVTLSANTAGLSPGTYNGTITVTATDATNSPAAISATLIVTSNYNGSWAGRTAQDSTITFLVQNNGITTLYFGYFAIGSICSVRGRVTTNFTTPINVSGGSFSAGGSTSTTTYTIAGTFAPGNSASGTLNVSYSAFVAGLGQCTASASTTWTATKP
ncbi:MAG: BACON domain-containing protein [Gemmatimonadetes bacterium]|nr:BACON domain-containing protein [Gemmatimonadota bacterium]